MNRLIFFLRFLLLALALLAYAKPATAQPKPKPPDCGIFFNAQMYFGTINLLDGGTKTTSTDLNYQCSGDPGVKVLLCISAGPTSGGGYDPRHLTLEGQSSQMAFNLYSNSSYSSVLGSVDSGGSYPPMAIIFTIPPAYYGTGTVPIYAKISTLGQAGLPAGTYNSKYKGGWPFKLNYRVYQEGESTSNCNTSFIGSSTANLYIEAVTASECRIDAASTMNFGDAPSVLTTNLDSTSTISVTCNNVSYRVDLNNGQNSDGSTRRMTGTAGYVRYELYRDSSRNNRWGTVNDGVNGTGTGTPQQLTVYGRVPPQTMPGDGSYSDVITVSVAY